MWEALRENRGFASEVNIFGFGRRMWKFRCYQHSVSSSRGLLSCPLLFGALLLNYRDQTNKKATPPSQPRSCLEIVTKGERSLNTFADGPFLSKHFDQEIIVFDEQSEIPRLPKWHFISSSSIDLMSLPSSFWRKIQRMVEKRKVRAAPVPERKWAVFTGERGVNARLLLPSLFHRVVSFIPQLSDIRYESTILNSSVLERGTDRFHINILMYQICYFPGVFWQIKTSKYCNPAPSLVLLQLKYCLSRNCNVKARQIVKDHSFQNKEGWNVAVFKTADNYYDAYWAPVRKKKPQTLEML